MSTNSTVSLKTSTDTIGPAPLRTLCDLTLRQLRPVADVPGYDRRTLTPAVVQISVGNFHRAHQGVYLDDVEHPESPGTAFGFIVEGLDRRRRRNGLPFTVLSCDTGAHSALGHLAELAGFTTAAAAMADPVVRRFVEGYLAEVRTPV